MEKIKIGLAAIKDKMYKKTASHSRCRLLKLTLVRATLWSPTVSVSMC